jgi:hypothetical protein
MSDLSILGTTVNGTAGAAGQNATSPGTAGGTGATGGTATNAVTGANIGTASWPPTGMDSQGGNGGAAGLGGAGLGASASYTSQEFLYEGSHDYYLTTTKYRPADRGGDGGSDGTGGNAITTLSSTTFTASTFYLSLDAFGGGTGDYSGFAKSGGAGGNAGYNELDYGYSRSGAVVLMNDVTGGTGGAGGNGGRGGDGGSASTLLRNLSVATPPGSDGYASFSLVSEGAGATGGGSGGGGGNGAVAGRSGNGGAGGNGGSAIASVAGVTADVSGGYGYGRVSFLLIAEGNNGGPGGDGGGAVSGDSRTTDASGNVTGTTTYGVAGNGGGGGNGGNATASFSGNTIDAAGTGIFVTLQAQAGAGGEGGTGGSAGASSVVSGIVVTAGTPGASGTTGQAGTGRLSFTNNLLDLNGTNSTLSITLQVGPGGAPSITLNGASGGNLVFSGNTLNGGGHGTLDLYAQGSPVLINSLLNQISIGGSAANALTGFVSFATEGATTFVLGTGTAAYDAEPYSSGVADRFIVGKGHGNADINNIASGFGSPPVIEFHDYGASLTTFAQVLADATIDANGNTVITTPDGSTLALGVSLSALTASEFQFTTTAAVTASLALSGTAESLTGTAAANAAITLTAGTISVGTTTANAAGQWSLAPRGLAAGLHTVTVTETDSYGFTQSAAVADVVSGPALALTTGADHVTGTGNDVVIARDSTLSAGDTIDGGPGANTLVLFGGGTFNLAAPTILVDLQTLAAREGHGATAQTVTLRAGLNLAVRVASDSSGDANPGITIIGAANTDVITLGSGNDTVTLGAGETVNAGSGVSAITVTAANETVNDGTGQSTISLSAASLGAAIHGGAGNTLVIAGGGTAALGANISGIAAVRLASTTNFSAGASGGLAISGSATGHDVITLGAATDSVVAGGTNELIRASAATASALVSGLGRGSALEITTGGTVALNAATGGSANAYLTVQLDAATNLTLGAMQFVHVIGGAGADTITAGAINQALAGGLGADVLVGYAGGHDVFQDTVAGLQSDTIGGFVATDRIDITNLAAAGAKLSVTAGTGTTGVSVVSGASHVSFVMTGAFSQSGFSLGNDGSGGLALTHS